MPHDLEQRRELLGQRRGAAAPHVRLAAFERAAEAFVVEGLEQVVERRHLEGAQGVCIIGGDEDDRRPPVTGAAQQLEGVAAGHLHVQEHQLGLAEQRQRVAPVAGLADQPDLGIAGEQAAQHRPRQRLIVDDQHADGFAGHDRPSSPAAISTGWR